MLHPRPSTRIEYARSRARHPSAHNRPTIPTAQPYIPTNFWPLITLISATLTTVSLLS